MIYIGGDAGGDPTSRLVKPVCGGAPVGGNYQAALTEITVGSAKRGWVEKPAITD